MYYTLSKSEKKIARAVMDKGLENHYIRSLSEAEAIIKKWREGGFKNTRDAYMKLYKSIEKNDDNIGLIYNDKGGSRWVEVIAWQLHQGVITLEDLKDFDDKLRNTIIDWSGI
jgi:hypothetical protein